MKRWTIVVGLALSFALGATFVSRTTTGLRLRHAVQLWLVRVASVADFEIERVGRVRMFLNPQDSVVTRGIMADGVWEENETHWFTRFVGPGDTVIDIGANVGYYTVLASQLVGDQGRVYAFEPEPTAFALLEQNVRVSGARNVVLEQKAVSNENGTLQLFLAAVNKGDHRIYQTDDRAAIDVEAVRLDDYLAGIGGAIDFVKIDTQGAEALIIAGMDDTIRDNPGIVMAVEFSPQALQELGTSGEEFLARLRAHDFRMFDLGPGMPGIMDLREVTPEGLIKGYAPDRWPFTNILLLKGFNELRRLTWDAESKRRALEKEVARGRPESQRVRDARAVLTLAEAALVEYRDSPVPR